MGFFSIFLNAIMEKVGLTFPVADGAPEKQQQFLASAPFTSQNQKQFLTKLTSLGQKLWKNQFVNFTLYTYALQLTMQTWSGESQI